MKKAFILKKQNGITLIALIISIIVLVILAAISIRMVIGENSLIARTIKVKEDIEEAQLRERLILVISAARIRGLTYDNLNDELLYEFGENNYTIEPQDKKCIITTWTNSGKEVTETVNVEISTVNIKIGDYIRLEEKLLSKTYETKTEETGYTEKQTFNTNKNAEWVVINVNNGIIEIMATKDTLSAVGNDGLYFYGTTGYDNCEKVLTDICQELYNTTYGNARSLDKTDIDSLVYCEWHNPCAWNCQKWFIDGAGVFEVSEGSKGYWLASKTTLESAYGIEKYNIAYLIYALSKWHEGEDTSLKGDTVKDESGDIGCDPTDTDEYACCHGIRPVITLKSGIEFGKSPESTDSKTV